jgi:hypothetical protein
LLFRRDVTDIEKIIERQKTTVKQNPVCAGIKKINLNDKKRGYLIVSFSKNQ